MSCANASPACAGWPWPTWTCRRWPNGRRAAPIRSCASGWPRSPQLRREVVEAEAAGAPRRGEIAALEREQARLVDLIVRLDDDSEATRARRARVDALDSRDRRRRGEPPRLAARIDALRRETADLMAE
jgi:hypothetical protein